MLQNKYSHDPATAPVLRRRRRSRQDRAKVLRPKVSLSNVAESVIELIIPLLDTEDLPAVRQACQSFREAVGRIRTWDAPLPLRLQVDPHDPSLALQRLATFASNFPRFHIHPVKVQLLSQCEAHVLGIDLPANSLATVLSALAEHPVTALHLERKAPPGNYWEPWPNLIPLPATLKELELHGSCQRMSWDALTSLRALTRLSLRHGWLMPDGDWDLVLPGRRRGVQDLYRGLRCMTQLRSLSLACRHTDQLWIGETISQLTALTHLELDLVLNTEEDEDEEDDDDDDDDNEWLNAAVDPSWACRTCVGHLAALPHLQELSVRLHSTESEGGDTPDLDGVLAAMCELGNLRSLELEGVGWWEWDIGVGLRDGSVWEHLGPATRSAVEQMPHIQDVSVRVRRAGRSLDMVEWRWPQRTAATAASGTAVAVSRPGDGPKLRVFLGEPRYLDDDPVDDDDSAFVPGLRSLPLDILSSLQVDVAGVEMAALSKLSKLSLLTELSYEQGCCPGPPRALDVLIPLPLTSLTLHSLGDVDLAPLSLLTCLTRLHLSGRRPPPPRPLHISNCVHPQWLPCSLTELSLDAMVVSAVTATLHNTAAGRYLTAQILKASSAMQADKGAHAQLSMVCDASISHAVQVPHPGSSSSRAEELSCSRSRCIVVPPLEEMEGDQAVMLKAALDAAKGLQAVELPRLRELRLSSVALHNLDWRLPSMEVFTAVKCGVAEVLQVTAPRCRRAVLVDGLSPCSKKKWREPVLDLGGATCDYRLSASALLSLTRPQAVQRLLLNMFPVRHTLRFPQPLLRPQLATLCPGLQRLHLAIAGGPAAQDAADCLSAPPATHSQPIPRHAAGACPRRGNLQPPPAPTLLPELRHLTLDVWQDDEGMHKGDCRALLPAVAGLASLQRLELRGRGLKDADVAALSALSALTSLTMLVAPVTEPRAATRRQRVKALQQIRGRLVKAVPSLKQVVFVKHAHWCSRRWNSLEARGWFS